MFGEDQQRRGGRNHQACRENEPCGMRVAFAIVRFIGHMGGLVLLLINVMLICAAGLLTIAVVHLDELE